MLFTAVKLPLVLLLTLAFTFPLAWVWARACGLSLGLLEAVKLTTTTLAIAAVVLASLSPVALLFTWSAGSPSDSARTTHNALYLSHTALVGAAALVGTRALWLRLTDLEHCETRRWRIFATWLLTYAFVGGEVAWAMRPFVGSIYAPITFLRSDALDGNVYEFILLDILPHLARLHLGAD